MDITKINEALAAVATRNSSLVKQVSTETIKENDYENGSTGEHYTVYQSVSDPELFVKKIVHTDSYGDMTNVIYQIVTPVEKTIIQYENI